MGEKLIAVISLSGCPLLIVVVSIFMLRFPQDRNSGIGYRTGRSVKSDAAWYAAQAYFAKGAIISGVILTVLSAVVLTYFAKQDMSSDEFAVPVIVTSVVQAAVIIAVIAATEMFLARNFDSNGNPK